MSTDARANADVQPAIVVGVDGSDANLGALRWAADEAYRTGVRLRLVAAIVEELRTHADIFFSGPEIDREIATSLASARELLRHPPYGALDVDTHILVGHAVKVLVASSRDATLLVLGRRGRGVFTRMLLGSVSAAAACRAAVPAVVVPSRWDPEDHTAEPVVVGVDGSQSNDEALRFAFEMALARQVPLHAVHVSDTVEVLSWAPPGSVIDPMWHSIAEATLDHAISPWCAKYPEVSVCRIVRQGHPVAVLLDVAAGAQALVVGGRRHRRLPGEILGSVALGVLDHAELPVIVVHDKLSSS